MITDFYLPDFISKHVTGRDESLFSEDVNRYHDQLTDQIFNKSLLVIGGAGTIGSHFIKSLLKFHPSKLYVVDTNENGLTELTRDLQHSDEFNVPDEYKSYPLDFNSTVFEKLFLVEGPFDIVANFAAHKHVRSEKDQYSIEAMIRNNVISAKKLLDLLSKTPPQRFFCVSTDKAANPVNIMGASKQLMEDLIMSYANSLHITTARFANVAFSNGSLLFGFIERLMKKQPFSSPQDVKRYFISPEESGDLCMLACMLGESGDIFFPKLEETEMKTFSSIAEALLLEVGYVADKCGTEDEARQKAATLSKGAKQYPVYFFASDTSGEKLYEEFYTEGEEIDWDSFKGLGVIKDSADNRTINVNEMLQALEDLFMRDELQKNQVVELLNEYIPNFQHIEKGKNLDQRM